jgi:hypothetical protein
MEIDIPSVREELDEDNIEPICEKRRAKKDKILSKIWCFEYVLHKNEKKEELEWQMDEVYEYGKLISYLVYAYYELLDGTRKISGFCRLKKRRNRRGAFGQLFNGTNWNWLYNVDIINFRRQRATAFVHYITKDDHHYNFYDYEMH